MVAVGAVGAASGTSTAVSTTLTGPRVRMALRPAASISLSDFSPTYYIAHRIARFPGVLPSPCLSASTLLSNLQILAWIEEKFAFAAMADDLRVGPMRVRTALSVCFVAAVRVAAHCSSIFFSSA